MHSMAEIWAQVMGDETSSCPINTHCSYYMLFKLNGQVGPWIVVRLHAATKMWVGVRIFFPLQLFLSQHLSFLHRTMTPAFFFSSQRSLVRPGIIMYTTASVAQMVNTAALQDSGCDTEHNSMTFASQHPLFLLNTAVSIVMSIDWELGREKRREADRWGNKELDSNFMLFHCQRPLIWVALFLMGAQNSLLSPGQFYQKQPWKKEAKPSWRGVKQCFIKTPISQLKICHRKRSDNL